VVATTSQAAYTQILLPQVLMATVQILSVLEATSARTVENSAVEFGAMVRYSAGPVNVGVGMQNHKDTIESVDRRESTAFVVAGNYDFKVAQAFVNYQGGEVKNDYGTVTTASQTQPTTSAPFATAGALNKRSISEIGVAVPVGALRLAASFYIGASEAKTSEAGAVTKTDLTGYQAAVLYSLSKRTNLYAVYGATKASPPTPISLTLVATPVGGEALVAP